METTPLTIEEMVTKTYKGIMCKVCEGKGYGVLFRTARSTNKSKWSCHKCIVKTLEESFGNDSDENKRIQDYINKIKV